VLSTYASFKGLKDKYLGGEGWNLGEVEIIRSIRKIWSKHWGTDIRGSPQGEKGKIKREG